MMVAVRLWRPGRLAVDVAVCVAAALVTAAGPWDKVAAWLPHSAIVPLAVGQGLLLLARRRAPMAVLAAATLLGVFMLAVGYPAVAAIFAPCCAAYALAVYGRRAGGAELAGTLRGAARRAARRGRSGRGCPGSGRAQPARSLGPVHPRGADRSELGSGVRAPHPARLRGGAEGPRGAARGGGGRARCAGGRGRAAAHRPRAARRHRPLDQPDRDPVGGRGPLRPVEPGRGPGLLGQDLGREPAGARGDARRAGRAAPGRRGGAEPAARARAGGRARREPARGRPGDAARGGADAPAARNSTGGLPDRAGVADQRPQARRGRCEGRRHHHPKRRNGAGLGTRRRRGTQRPGLEHGPRDRRDARAGSRVRRDPAHRCPAGRRVRGRGIDPPARQEAP